MRKVRLLFISMVVLLSLATAPTAQAKAKITKPSAPTITAVSSTVPKKGKVNVLVFISLPTSNGGAAITGSKVKGGGKTCAIKKTNTYCHLKGIPVGTSILISAASKNKKGFGGYSPQVSYTGGAAAFSASTPTPIAAPIQPYVPPAPTPTSGTLVIDAQGLDTLCEFGLNGSIPITSSGPSPITNNLVDGNESFTVSNGTYTIYPSVFNCSYRYEPLSTSVTATVTGGNTTVAVITFVKIAEMMYGRTWNDGITWRVPLGLYPENVDFDEVQFRIVGEQGSWLQVHPSNWYVDGTGHSRNLRVADYIEVDLEFRVVKHGFRNGNYQVIYAWYSPYTCGYDSCTYPSYNLINSPLN
jgi:hypothetical protein